jgi:Na+/H+ antiporter NhaD/arsenite permease-like protein
MDTTVWVIFGLVYLGMILGGLPGLALDRTGVALLGAIALLATDRISPDAAWRAVDVPTLGLLFGLMVASAQLRLGGLYSVLTRRVGAAEVTPAGLLGRVVLLAALLSAVLANDIVCLAMAPLLIEACAKRGLKPRPFLLALACAANVGSAATLIGNPQNMLVGQTLNLSFVEYLLAGGPPALLGCCVVWFVIVRSVQGRWTEPPMSLPVTAPPLDSWQAAKGVIAVALLVMVFLLTDWPREVAALTTAGVLLLSRKMHTRPMLALVDWDLLVLFIGLFVVNHAVQASGALDASVQRVEDFGIAVRNPVWLFVVAVALSNVVSNVPAVMLLLPVADHPMAGPILAVSSTLAGNLFLVGSVANIIVVDQANRMGVRISWREHAAIGVPVTIASLVIAAAWLGFLASWR